MSPVQTRQRILVELRRGGHTVRELADTLDVTSNAVRDHVDVLQERGLVEATDLRRGTGGKPARVYGLTARGEDSFGTAYTEVLGAVVESLESNAEEAETRRVLEEAGRRLAHQLGPAQDGFEERVRTAAAVLDGIGGMTEVRLDDGTATISGTGCPLSALVRDHPAACHLARALVAELTGRPVREECERGPRPSCAFTVCRGGT